MAKSQAHGHTAGQFGVRTCSDSDLPPASFMVCTASCPARCELCEGRDCASHHHPPQAWPKATWAHFWSEYKYPPWGTSDSVRLPMSSLSFKLGGDQAKRGSLTPSLCTSYMCDSVCARNCLKVTVITLFSVPLGSINRDMQDKLISGRNSVPALKEIVCCS